MPSLSLSNFALAMPIITELHAVDVVFLLLFCIFKELLIRRWSQYKETKISNSCMFCKSSIRNLWYNFNP